MSAFDLTIVSVDGSRVDDGRLTWCWIEGIDWLKEMSMGAGVEFVKNK